jgi:LacI family transcriptional regulator, galactose operon repressor
MSMKKRATLKEVARKAGVSLGMAGRVLGNYGSYSKATQQKVRAAARAVQYSPNTIAKALKTRLTKTAGVLISDITASFWTTMVRGIQDRAGRDGYSIIVCNSDEESHSEKASLTALMERSIDGLIICPTLGNYSALKKLSRAGTPMVFVDRKVAGIKAPSIRVDNRAGAREAVSYLAGLGHRRIAVIKGINGVETSEERYAGYAEALAAHGLSVRPSLVKEGRFSKNPAFEATRELLSMKSRPSAIFVCNELMASGCMLALKEAGVVIPQEMSLIVFDDPVWAAYTSPPITGMSQPSYTMGILAFDYLLNQISKPKANAQRMDDVVLKTTLVIRESCRKV